MSKHFVRRGIFWTSIVLGLTASSIVTAQQRPVPTSDRTVPRPPAIPGCYTLSRIVTKDEAPRWKKAECASPEELSHLPHPTFGGSLGTPGIQTQSKSFPLLPALFPQHPASFSATPGLANGAVSVQFPLQESWTVTDSASGNTSFSVQLTSPCVALGAGHSSAPVVMAALAGAVHYCQGADDHNRGEDNQQRRLHSLPLGPQSLSLAELSKFKLTPRR